MTTSENSSASTLPQTLTKTFESDFRQSLLENECGGITGLEYEDMDIIARMGAASFESVLERRSVDLLLFCPQCGEQRVDEPQPEKDWNNPPHRSHECQFCNHIWRPSDVATNGVLAIQTKGQRDGNARPRYFATAHDYEQAELEQVLGRLRQGEKLLAHACENGCGYPCGYVMRGGEFCLDRQCWCTQTLKLRLAAA